MGLELTPGIIDDYFYLMCASIAFWFTVYIFSKDFGSNPIILSGHSVVAVILSAVSLYFHDESKFPEAFVICFGVGFFMVDTFDCILRMDLMFLLHGILGLSFLYFASTTRYYPMRAASMGYFVEISTPLYHRWKGKKTKETLGHFLLSFFLSRIVWLPIFVYIIFSATEYNKWVVYAFTMFYILNCVWFGKGIQLYKNYKADYRALD
mmetsp:Transcript_3260/g.3799  ORF Transcript_3260/g.3799 Transcript_3260/m.3799 type:complete len:208 (-) Transcript_3260:71-694(-)